MTVNCDVIGSLSCTEPVHELQSPMQTALDASILRLSGAKNASIETKLSTFPHPDIDLSWDVMTFFGSQFLYGASVKGAWWW